MVAELAAATLSQPVSPARKYVPLFELPEMDQLRVTVVPRGMAITRSDRRHNTHDVQVDIAVQQKFSTGEPDEIDPLVNLVEEIADLFRLKRLSSFPGAIWTKTEHNPIYAQDHWEQLRQFTSVLTLSFRVVR